MAPDRPPAHGSQLPSSRHRVVRLGLQAAGIASASRGSSRRPAMTTDTVRRPDAEAPPTFEGRPLPDPTEPAWDQGLAFDVETLIDRRRVLKGIGLAGLSIGIAACAPGSGSASASASASAAAGSASAAAADCTTEIPEETAGPFPGDGSNG